MTRELDVLVLDDRPDALETERVLLGAGHRVHRCRPVGDDGFACDGIRPGRQCPLDGQIDVALITRHEPGAEMPDGARCAVRLGVPIVEQGPSIPDRYDPYASFIAHHVRPGESIVSGCELAAENANDPLARAIAERIHPVLDAAHMALEAVRTDIDRIEDALVVQVTVPGSPDRRLEQAIAVRVLDAVRATTRTYGQVNVRVQGLEQQGVGR